MLGIQFFEKVSTAILCSQSINLLWKHGKETIMSKKTYPILIMSAIMVLAVTLITAGCCSTEEQTIYGPINISSEALLIEHGQSVNLSAKQAEDLTLNWRVDDELLGSLKMISNNEAVFTSSSKSGTVTIIVTAPNTGLESKIQIKIFASPTLSVKILSDSWIEVEEDYKYFVSYPMDGSVIIDKIYVTDKYNDPVEGLDTRKSIVCFTETGTYNLTVVGHDFLGRNIQSSVIFSVMPVIEAISSIPDSIELKSMAPEDILAVETFLKGNLQIDVNLKKVVSNGKTVTGNGKSLVAFLFVRDLHEKRVWITTGVNIFDFYPKDKFKAITVKSNLDGNSWTVIVGYSAYTEQITCVAIFPSIDGYYFDSSQNDYSNNDDSSFSGEESSSGGSVVPPIVSPSGPSPKPL